ncbi:hypothetical protein L0337_10230 [candidate division KSB1 bacterium]|nr:hypothetical protein [candidate division KSB1 bacterium]
MKNQIIHDIAIDLEGNLWFGMDKNGACRHNLPAGSFRCLDQNDYPGLGTVKTVFKDPDNNLWFGMSDLQGVIRLNNNWFTFGNEELPNLPNLFVFSLLAVNDTLWVGTANGIRRFKGEARVGEDILPPIKFGIKALAPAERSQVWVGTDNGIYLYDANGMQKCYVNLDSTGKSPRKNQVNEIIQGQNEVWIAADSLLSRVRATDCSLIKTYSRESTLGGLINDQILAIAFDKTGKLWCGTPAGASVYDPPTDKWVATYTTANGLFEDNLVTAIAVDPTNGEVWIGTGSGGISIYDDKNKKWQHLDRRTVLADNSIAEIVFSGSGEVFVATPRGVSRRDQNGIWCTFDSQSGLASEYVVSIALQGDLRWFGTYGAGLTRYRPPQSLPETFIETRFDVTDKSEVIYRFSAADLNTALNEFRYRYALDDTTQWSEPTSDRFAVVKGIMPGPHTFYVQAIDRDSNLDPMPDRDFFTRLAPALGGSSTITDTSFHEIGPIAVSVYWPPNLLKKNTTILIEPDTAIAATLFAFRLTSSETFQLRKPITLTFSFPDTGKKLDNFRADSLGIFKIEGNRFLELGGAYSSQNKMISISTAILELGVYAVKEREKPAQRTAASDSLQKAFRVTAQPRIIRRDDLQTTISFRLDQAAQVRIQVYNLAGRLVGTIWDEFMQPGINAVPWNGKDKNGYPCPPGLYLITLQSDGFKPPPKPVKVMVLNK